MATHVWISGLVVLALASLAGAYRDCFQCDSAGDYKSAKACQEKDPEGFKMNSIRMPDEDECFLCIKTVNDDTEQVVRSCISRETWSNTYKSEFNNKDSCENIGNTKVCLCESNLCNGAGTALTSLAALVLAVFYRVLV